MHRCLGLVLASCTGFALGLDFARSSQSALGQCRTYKLIHKNTEQNPSNCDMELQLARITFFGCEIINFEPGVPWITDASGKSYPAEPLITYTGHEAKEMLLHELNCTTCIYAFRKSDCERWRMAGCGDEPYFEAQISFDTVTVEWDEFRRPAWYVLRERGIHA